MRKIIMGLLLIGCAWQAAAQEGTISPEEIKKAQEIMNSPQYKQQMQQMMQKMEQQGIDTEGMKNMPQISGKAMESAMGMHKCMQEKMGPEGMKHMQEMGMELGTQIKELCKDGKPDQAEQLQKEFAEKMMHSQEHKGMQECAEKHKDMMDDPAFADMRKRMETMQQEHGEKHICEHMK